MSGGGAHKHHGADKVFKGSIPQANSEMNITPMIDVLLVLLVIFIITTPQLVNNLEMNLPSGKPPADAPKPKINNIVVSETGAIFLNGDGMTLVE